MKNIDFGFVADLYDSYVNVDFDIEFYKKLVQMYAGKSLELMCGTGRVSIPLLKQKADIVCVDYSEEMLAVFREKALVDNLAPQIVCQDVCDLDLKQTFDLIFIPFNSFSEICDKEKQRRALFGIYEHLNDNGVFFCTLYNPAYRIKTADGQLRILGKYSINQEKDLILSYYNQFDEQSGHVSGMQFYEIYDQQHRLIDKRFMDIRFSLISKNDFITMAEKAGFKVKAVYGDYQFTDFDESSLYMNFLLEK